MVAGPRSVHGRTGGLDLKTILHSKRANLYYLQHCRVLVNGGRVEYATDAESVRCTGTFRSRTPPPCCLEQARRLPRPRCASWPRRVSWLASAAAAVRRCSRRTKWMPKSPGFLPRANTAPPPNICRPGSGSGSMTTSACARPRHSNKRVPGASASNGCCVRSRRPVSPPAVRLQELLARSSRNIELAQDNTALLTEEARLTKALFKLAVDTVGHGAFTRAKRGTGNDPAHRFLDHGNYLAYGLGATATWVLGLPHGLAGCWLANHVAGASRSCHCHIQRQRQFLARDAGAQDVDDAVERLLIADTRPSTFGRTRHLRNPWFDALPQRDGIYLRCAMTAILPLPIGNSRGFVSCSKSNQDVVLQQPANGESITSYVIPRTKSPSPPKCRDRGQCFCLIEPPEWMAFLMTGAASGATVYGSMPTKSYSGS